MDRLSFINEKYSINGGDKQNNKCRDDNCICERLTWSAGNKKVKTSPVVLGTMTMVAFLFATSLFLIRNRVADKGNILGKRERTIACAPLDYSFEKTDEGTAARRRPDDRNGTTCPHQFGSYCALCSNDPKRKRNHTS